MVRDSSADTHPTQTETKTILQKLPYIIVQLKPSEMKDSVTYDF